MKITKQQTNVMNYTPLYDGYSIAIYYKVPGNIYKYLISYTLINVESRKELEISFENWIKNYTMKKDINLSHENK